MNAYVNPTRIIPIRASSLGDLFGRTARWEAKNLLNKRNPAGARTRLGTAIHEAVTQWDHLNLIIEEVSLEECEEILHHQIWQPNEEVDWSDLDQNSAESIGQSLMHKYITHCAYSEIYRCGSALWIINPCDLGIELTGISTVFMKMKMVN